MVEIKYTEVSCHIKEVQIVWFPFSPVGYYNSVTS